MKKDKGQHQIHIEKHARFQRSALAMCIVALSAPSFGQTDTETEVIDEIIVSGVRTNLQNAQDIKRNADTFVDSISAEDIGSLPDRSVLEAMQRIPGVSIERFASANDPDHIGVEGSGAVIRGMSATRSEFNGRDSFTANSGRGLSFQDVPPELMGGVDVFKNQSADMIEGGIGGTVSLRTRKPFDAPGRVIAFNADMSYGDMAEEWTPTVSALFSDRWDTSAGEFGVLFNASSSSLKGISHGINADAYIEYRDDYSDFYRPLDPAVTPENATSGVHAGPSNINGAEAFVDGSVWLPAASNASMKFDDRERTGFAAALQWESPDETLLATFQFLRSDATLNWKENAVKHTASNNKRNTLPLEGTAFEFDDDGLFQSGTITQDGNFSDGGWRSSDADNPDLLRIPRGASWATPFVPQFGHRFSTDNRHKRTETVIDDFATNFKWTPTDNIELSLDLQHIKATTEDDDVVVMLNTHAIQAVDFTGSTPRVKYIEPWNGLRDNHPDAYGVAGENLAGTFGDADPANDRLMPGFSNDPAGDSNWFQDPTSYLWASAMDHFERSEGESNAARLDGVFRFDESLVTAVRAGIRYAKREQTVRDSGYNWGSLGPTFLSPYDNIAWTDEPFVADLQGEWETVDWSDFHRGGVMTVPGNVFLHPSDKVVQDVTNSIALPKSPLGTHEPAALRQGAESYFLPSDVFITEETNQAAYIRVDFGSDDYAYGFAGNIGLRYVELERTATGSVRYPDVLPEYAPPAGAPSVFDKPALDAWEAEQEADFIAANPAANEAAIDAHMEEVMRFANDSGNYLSETELGFGNDAATIEDATSTFDVILPSFNLKVDLTDEVIARFAVSKAIAMPDMSLVRNTTTLNPFETNRDVTVLNPEDPELRETILNGASINGWSGNAGNPFLQPMESVQYDASIEWYFDTVGSLTFSLFRKDLTNFFVNGAIDRVYTNPTTGITQVASVDSTRNEGDGLIQGFEIAYQQFYDMLPEPWDGLGLQANFSYIDSKSLPNAGDLGEDPLAGGDNDTGARVDLSGLPLQGQSKETFNIVAMYDKYDWSARLAYNWRSRYLVTTRDEISRFPLWNDDAGFLDASVFYNVNDNITVGMQFTNLLNTQTKTIMILDGEGLEAGRSWFVNDRRVALLVKAQF